MNRVIGSEMPYFGSTSQRKQIEILPGFHHREIAFGRGRLRNEADE
jgi:hypothetical protein